ncbi:hypothetical protein O9H85_23215 [Paenibacillus filicis]|uniref:Uncharacterized protein n=1 Tax=Paenibacillus gyeongsangnamensis TaxID=3388067 RepID=A0ABT4QEJ3_9BACL|nr:hypothetical protein [Paenibacillus filicis]MCZ8515270.1 hypothetical protein [Paenibacillus filicis]
MREHTPESPMTGIIELELQQMFAGRATWHTVTKRDQDLDISVVEIKGLAAWSNEDEVLDYVETRMQSDCWEWLNGYQVNVILKEDAGSCRWKK